MSFESEHTTQFSYSISYGINISLNGSTLKKDGYIPAGSHTITLKSTINGATIKELSLKKVDNIDDIIEMIQVNSNVEIVDVINNTEDPWLVVGKDSLRTANTRIGDGLISITYQSDANVMLEYSQGDRINIILDDVTLDDDNKLFYLPSGKHTLTIKKSSTSSQSYIYGFAFNKVCKDSDIEAMIEKISDVDVNITNDTICPWIISEINDSLYNKRSTYSSIVSTLAIEFNSEYITSLNYTKSECELYVNGERCYSYNNYMPAGKNIVLLKCNNNSYVTGLSIKKVCSDEDIEKMIENNSDVDITFKNDSLHPWYIEGQDSLVNSKTNYTGAKISISIAYQSDSI